MDAETTTNTNETDNDFLGENDELNAMIKEWRKETFQIEGLPTLVENINSDDENKQLYGTIGVRKLVSTENDPPIQDIIDANLLPRFIEFIKKKRDQPELQFEAAWVLCNVASGTTQQVKELIERGALPHFISLLHSKHDKIVDQAIWALGNIAGDSVHFRDMILEQEGAKILVKILNTTSSLQMKRQGSWALSNLCKGKPLPDYSKVQEIVPLFCSFLHNETDKEILADSAWGLSYLSEHSSDDQGVIPMGIVPILLKHLENPILTILTPCLRIIGSIIAATDGQTSMLVNTPNLIPQLFKVLESEKNLIRKEACWIFSNITAGTPEQIEMVLGDPVHIKKFTELALNDSDKVRMEAVWVLSNAASGCTAPQAVKLVQNNVFECFVNLLQDKNPRMIQVVLQGISHILKLGQSLGGVENPFVVTLESLGGIEKIEALQSHASDEIYKLAVKILEEFFALEEEAY